MVTKETIELLDLALVCMGLGDVDSALPELEEIHVPRATFDGAEILHEDLWDLIGDEQEIFADVRHRDLSGPLDVRLLTHSMTGGQRRPLDEEFVLQRYRRISPQAVRGAASFITPNMVEWMTAFVAPHQGKIETTRSYWGEIKPFHWTRIDNFPYRDRTWEQPSDVPGFNRAEFSINLAHGFAFTNRYQWSVYLGTPRFPGITVPTTPSAAMEVFKLRDAPEEGRRAALRHWVRQHIRAKAETPTNEAEEILVREHLRGATAFRWNDLTCKITPSKFDLDRNERLRAETRRRRKG